MIRTYCGTRCTRLGAILEGEYHRASSFSSHAQLGICIVRWCLWRPWATRMLRSSLGEPGQGYDKINAARGMETLPGTAWPSRQGRPRPSSGTPVPASRPRGVLLLVIICWLLAPHSSASLTDDSSHLFQDPRTTTSPSHPPGTAGTRTLSWPQASHIPAHSLPTAAFPVPPWRRAIYEARLLRPAREETSRSGQPSPSHW